MERRRNYFYKDVDFIVKNNFYGKISKGLDDGLEYVLEDSDTIVRIVSDSVKIGDNRDGMVGLVSIGGCDHEIPLLFTSDGKMINTVPQFRNVNLKVRVPEYFTYKNKQWVVQYDNKGEIELYACLYVTGQKKNNCNEYSCYVIIKKESDGYSIDRWGGSSYHDIRLGHTYPATDEEISKIKDILRDYGYYITEIPEYGFGIAPILKKGDRAHLYSTFYLPKSVKEKLTDVSFIYNGNIDQKGILHSDFSVESDRYDNLCCTEKDQACIPCIFAEKEVFDDKRMNWPQRTQGIRQCLRDKRKRLNLCSGEIEDYLININADDLVLIKTEKGYGKPETWECLPYWQVLQMEKKDKKKYRVLKYEDNKSLWDTSEEPSDGYYY